ncbi:MAG TPA: 23S rRNA (guanosine(2251)-2'-O)-methyltransferase RlmB [Acidimicrobiia bacterium]|nr:23S rRNA (guanosine(2251)-2'-O)-methyltransferase RlmB [Acidimicrobiia bacterium]
MSRGTDKVEGRRAVRELLKARRRRARTVWIGGRDLDDIADLAREAGVKIQRVPPEEIDRRARSESPQGVIAVADALPEVDLDRLLADPDAFLVALDGVTDPQNLGAVARTAESAGATGLVVPRHRAARITPTVTKAAAGALEHLPVAAVSGVPASLERARRADVWTVGLDADGDSDLFELAVADQPVMLVLGAEGSGLSRLARQRCDVLARIPMRGAIESLNVGAAAALACYEVARRRG